MIHIINSVNENLQLKDLRGLGKGERGMIGVKFPKSQSITIIIVLAQWLSFTRSSARYTAQHACNHNVIMRWATVACRSIRYTRFVIHNAMVFLFKPSRGGRVGVAPHGMRGVRGGGGPDRQAAKCGGPSPLYPGTLPSVLVASRGDVKFKICVFSSSSVSEQ